MSLFSNNVTNTSGGYVSNGLQSFQGLTRNFTDVTQKGFDRTGSMLGKIENKGGVVGVVGKAAGIVNDLVASNVKGASQIIEVASGLLSSAWGSSSRTVSDNSFEVATNVSNESKKYQTTNKTISEIKKSTGVQQLSELDLLLKNKANELNTITQTVLDKSSSFGGLSRNRKTYYNYWQEASDQLLSRYGFETYAQKASGLADSLKWMEVRDMNKLSADTYISQVNDTAGQDVERQISRSQMNNYFGQYYVDTARA